MNPNNCRNCRKPTQLLPKYDSETNIGWVTCDECGNTSKPINLNKGRNKIIAQWNTENPTNQQEITIPNPNNSDQYQWEDDNGNESLGEI